MGNCAFTSTYFLHSKKPVLEGFRTILAIIHIFHISYKQDFWDSSFHIIFEPELITPLAITPAEPWFLVWELLVQRKEQEFTQSLDSEEPRLGLVWKWVFKHHAVQLLSTGGVGTITLWKSGYEQSLEMVTASELLGQAQHLEMQDILPSAV